MKVMISSLAIALSLISQAFAAGTGEWTSVQQDEFCPITDADQKRLASAGDKTDSDQGVEVAPAE